MRAYSARIIPKGYEKRRREAYGNAVIGLFVGFLVAYVLSELLLASYPHPWHWLGASVGAGIGYVVTRGWLLHRINVEQSAKRKTHR